MKPATLRQRFNALEILKSLKWTFFRKGRWVAGSISISEESTMASAVARLVVAAELVARSAGVALYTGVARYAGAA
jgi:hypothetical protein